MRLIKWCLGLGLLFMIGAGVWLADYALAPSAVNSETVILIPRGSGLRMIKDFLAARGLIKDDIRFLILARLSGTARRLRSGEYLIPPRLKPLQILRILEKGEVIRHQITIPEGMTIRQAAGILAKDEWVDPQHFLALTRDRDFISSLGFELDNLEGYLFPDTYSLTRGDMDEKKIITMMVRRFLQVWKEFDPGQAMGLVRHQVVVLASIVEKETAVADERPLIARVFLNRLENNMRLQSDPTVIYGIEAFTGDLTREDLSRESPYNTYLITGLPPGPICNPGRESILAVLRPADAPYFYFVSKNDGTHYFSTTLEEHNRAVRKYQQKAEPSGRDKNSG